MQLIRVTTENESGVLIYNDKIIVLTDEDRKNYLELFNDLNNLNNTVLDRFRVLTDYVEFIENRIKILEQEKQV